MRLIVAIKLKNHVPHGTSELLQRQADKCNAALDRIQPWSVDNTTVNHLWLGAGARTAVLFRTNEAASIPERTGWDPQENRLWAWTGVVGRDALDSMSESRKLDPNTIEKLRDGIGSFGVIGATSESIVALTNSHRSESLFWAETADVVIFSNSAAALNLIVNNGQTRYSHLGLAGFLAHGLPATDTTLFSDVQTIPAGTKLEANSMHDIRFEADPGPGEHQNFDAAAEQIAAGLVDYVRILTKDANRVVAAVTGGKDSRLVVSALSAAGVDFSTYTNGLPESGDVIVGGLVTGRLGVEQERVAPKISQAANGHDVVTAKPEEQAWNTLRSTGGLGSAFTALADPSRRHQSATATVNLGGQGGEIIRGGWLRLTGNRFPTRDEAIALMHRIWLRHKVVLRPLALEAVLLDLAPLTRLTEENPAQALFDSYVSNRTGRWLSTMRHGESVVKSHTTPLINNQMVRHLGALPPEELLGERMAFRVMSHLAPSIVGLPFFRDRWSFEKEGPHDLFSPNTWQEREPYTAHDQPKANFNWRTAQSASLSEFFKEYILDSPQSQLFEVVERGQVERMLNGEKYRHDLAWALFSAQFALNDAWLESKPTAPTTVEVEIPR